MNSDTKEQYFYMQNKRCKVVANDQCITIQNELQPNCKFKFYLKLSLLEVILKKGERIFR